MNIYIYIYIYIYIFDLTYIIIKPKTEKTPTLKAYDSKVYLDIKYSIWYLINLEKGKRCIFSCLTIMIWVHCYEYVAYTSKSPRIKGIPSYKYTQKEDVSLAFLLNIQPQNAEMMY